MAAKVKMETTAEYARRLEGKIEALETELATAHRALSRIKSGEFCTDNCTAYIAAEFALKHMRVPRTGT